MERLIDANALMEEIKFEYDLNYGEILTDPRKFADMVEDSLTVDAVEVVRCKDCKHFVQGEPYDPCECMKWMVKFGVAYTTPDGYCHKAERKNENL